MPIDFIADAFTGQLTNAQQKELLTELSRQQTTAWTILTLAIGEKLEKFGFQVNLGCRDDAILKEYWTSLVSARQTGAPLEAEVACIAATYDYKHIVGLDWRIHNDSNVVLNIYFAQ